MNYPDVSEIKVTYYPNPQDNQNEIYPEDFKRISGAMGADGFVDYNGNGDGTINIYDTPTC